MSPPTPTAVTAALTPIITSSLSTSTDLSLRSIKSLLLSSGLEWTDEEWTEGKEGVREEVRRLVSELGEAKESKYDKAAGRNLENFMEMIAPAEDDEYDEGDQEDAEEQDEEEQETEGSSEVEILDPIKAPVPKKKVEVKKEVQGSKKRSKVVIYKSKETISDSDAEDDGLGTVTVGHSTDVEPRKKAKVVKEKVVKEKVVKEKKERVRKPPARKEGDAEIGTEEQETRITKLKALLVAAGGTRPFNGSTGPERTLSASDRIARIQEVLKGVGLNAEGALPSLAKATAIGEKRALAKEMKEISGAPILDSGLRGGKLRVGETKRSSAGFGAFLGDQSSDSD